MAKSREALISEYDNKSANIGADMYWALIVGVFAVIGFFVVSLCLIAKKPAPVAPTANQFDPSIKPSLTKTSDCPRKDSIASQA